MGGALILIRIAYMSVRPMVLTLFRMRLADIFGGVFDKRVWMLFVARRNEDGNPDLKSGQVVHRRDGVSKTVTENMWAGLSIRKQKSAQTCLTARQEKPRFSQWADTAGAKISRRTPP